MLEQQYVGGRQVVLQPSATLSYTVSTSGTAGTVAAPCTGSKVSAIAIEGVPVTEAGTYRITVNNFLADGGDGFTQLRLGTGRVDTAGDDLDAFVDYLTDNSPVGPPATTRITVVP